MLGHLPAWITTPWVATPLGLALLWLGAEALVHGATRIAASLGISQIVIGLTLVAFGTSLPELIVCLNAAFRSAPDFAVGNIVGSNIANIGLIAGTAAILMPLAVGRTFLQRDVLWAILAAVLVAAVAWGGQIGRFEGLFLLALFAVYAFRLCRGEVGVVAAETKPAGAHLSAGAMALESSRAVLGLLMLLVGAPLLLEGGTAAARALGVSELVIGLTLIAVGTSLPELATAVVAARRGSAAIVLGNVIGSNIFNVFIVLAVTSAITPIAVSAVAIRQDIPVMLGFTGLFLVIAITRRRLSRVEGLALVSLYVVYTAWLFIRGNGIA